jgi:preprotein translocase subunit SecF
MMFGVVLVGTYTSVFIASPILIYLGVGTARAQARDDDAPDEEPAPAKPEARPSSRPTARARR